MADLAFLDPRRRPRPLLRTLVGGVLRRHRQEQGRTLADVSRAARVSMPYLSELERGRKEASSEVLAAVCAALRIDLSDLLAEVWHDLAGEPAGLRRRDPAGEPAGLRYRDPAGDSGRAWPHRAPEPGHPTTAVSDRRVARPARRSADIVLLAA